MRERLDNILAKHTGRELKKIQVDTDRDFFMSSSEAKEYGLIDEVVTYRPRKEEEVKSKGKKK
jgi:ATP-dependent Clp protease protease subunit